MEKVKKYLTIKIFDKNTSGNFVMWRPTEDEELYVIKGTGWHLTESDEKPQPLSESQKLMVKKHHCYTFTGGESNLVLGLKSK